jgi:hypothetical protein
VKPWLRVHGEGEEKLATERIQTTFTLFQWKLLTRKCVLEAHQKFWDEALGDADTQKKKNKGKQNGRRAA